MTLADQIAAAQQYARNYSPNVLPLKTPLFDAQGRLTRPWLEYWALVAKYAGRSMRWRGTYLEDDRYLVNEVVRYGGSLWLALQPNPIRGEAIPPGTDERVWEYLLTPIPEGGTDGQVLAKASDTNYDVTWVDAAAGPAGGGTGVIGVVIDGGGSVPATGSKGYIQVPYDATITGWTMLADQAGAAQITVKKSTYTGFPTTASIVASAQPKITATNQKATSTTLTGWTVDLVAGEVLEFNLDSIATIQRLILELQVTKA